MIRQQRLFRQGERAPNSRRSQKSDTPVSSPSQQASRREQAVLVADALERLPEDYREVLLLRHWEGLTFIAIAQRMGRSEDAIEKLWLRALGRLRREMGAET